MAAAAADLKIYIAEHKNVVVVVPHSIGNANTFDPLMRLPLMSKNKGCLAIQGCTPEFNPTVFAQQSITWF